MSLPLDIARLVLRQAEEVAEEESSPVQCNASNEYDGRMGIRISSIFVILVASTFGMYLPCHEQGKSKLTYKRCCVSRVC